MPPIIGITTGAGTNTYGQPASLLTHAYSAAILDAGGVPILIPSALSSGAWKSLYSHLDGILLSGGGDIDSARYSAEPQPAVHEIDSSRDELELGLMQSAAADGKPFLGICRGCQLVNVAMGGTLYTHLPDQLPGALAHDQAGDQRKLLIHDVNLVAGTQVAQVLEELVIHVNSHHHQGLRDIGAGLQVAGQSSDGLVEAIELGGHPFGVAVQWHPEWLTDQAHARNLFRKFVEAASFSRGQSRIG